MFLNRSPPQRSHCTHIARLAHSGDINLNFNARIWSRLPDHTHAEMQRVLLGEQLSSNHNLCNLRLCEDSSFIHDVVQLLPDGGRECLFCASRSGDRFHWRHQCPASRQELAQQHFNVAGALATVGYCFWFDTGRRWRLLPRLQDLTDQGFSCNRTNSHLLEHHLMDKTVFHIPVDRASILLQFSSTPVNLPDQFRAVLHEVAADPLHYGNQWAAP